MILSLRNPQRRRAWFVALSGIVICLALGRLVYPVIRERLNGPSMVTPVPTDLDRLDPQLRDYLHNRIAWVNERSRAADRHATLGIIYSSNGLWHEARNAFANVVRLKPNEPLGHLYYAIATREAGDPVAALEKFRAVVKKFPAFAPGYYRLGEGLLRAGEFDGAEESFQQLIALAPGEWRGYSGRGEAILRRGRPADAVPWLEQATKIDPSARIAHHLLGSAYREQGRTNEAAREFALGMNALSYPMPDPWSTAMSQHMKLVPDQLRLASDYLAADRPDEAERLLTETARWHSDNTSVLTALATSALEQGKLERARKLFEQTLKLDPRNLAAHLGLTTVLQDAQLFDQALLMAERTIELEPDKPQGYSAKALTLVAAGRYAEAASAYETARSKDLQNALILVDLGDIYAQHLAAPDRAYEYYERARKLNPGLAVVYARLAGVLLVQKQFDAAGQLVKELEAFAPDDESLPGLRRQLEAQR